MEKLDNHISLNVSFMIPFTNTNIATLIVKSVLSVEIGIISLPLYVYIRNPETENTATT